MTINLARQFEFRNKAVFIFMWARGARGWCFGLCGPPPPATPRTLALSVEHHVSHAMSLRTCTNGPLPMRNGTSWYIYMVYASAPAPRVHCHWMVSRVPSSCNHSKHACRALRPPNPLPAHAARGPPHVARCQPLGPKARGTSSL